MGAEAPGLADGVQFVDEDDAGRLLLGRGKEISYSGGAHPHEHFHEIGARQAHKGHPGLSGHGPGQQGLAGARGTHQQDALGEVTPQNLKFGRVLQELDDFLQFLFGFFHAGHILEGDLGFVLDIDLGLTLAHGHEAAGAAADLPEEVDPDADEEQEGEHPGKERSEPGLFLDGAIADVVLGQELHQVRVFQPHGGEYRLFLVKLLFQGLGQVGFFSLFGQFVDALGQKVTRDGVGADGQVIDALDLHQVAKFAVTDLHGLLHGAVILEDRQQQD